MLPIAGGALPLGERLPFLTSLLRLLSLLLPHRPQHTAVPATWNHTAFCRSPEFLDPETSAGRYRKQADCYDAEVPNNLFLATSAITVAAGCLILRSAEIT